METQEAGALTADEVLALPPVVDLVTAGRAFGIGRSSSYLAARNGTFPVPVLRINASIRVVTAEILRALQLGPSAGDGASAC
ncbi:DNA-binding protein [Streptomyces sp. NPDC057456]|uniref:DNA-binding protein n=1 Tax=Streptomyces sp. NPDC057456 TaxID=3346139 RepID=UPI00368DE2D8